MSFERVAESEFLAERPPSPYLIPTTLTPDPLAMTDKTTSNDIDQLNSFLRGEISATETYTQAIEADTNAAAEAILRDNRVSHESRVALLRAEIKRMGGEPAEGSGVWGAFAKAVQGGAKLFGESAAVAAIEEGEDHGLKDYQGDLEDLSPATRSFVQAKLLPEQHATHDAAARLKKAMD